ncbi:FmdB family zinc ribbon protein [Undibacterium fentianense]|uniref:Zinc ribbon domain-containing protein n=1 Tax=Undibacterium fentianense TaxID=2828728 RepID=A0A941ID68_9BURK|nr:FmdB family zinc ribbon protein [Undibacterium fentianense]MBR7799638.1 zinc ribbon domain-containing protein [Undibacterium fentianense]
MPIYAYRCEACGFAKDVLQKMSEDPLTICPECQQASFKKQVTAAGFQLKGSGWYVTDFRGGGAAASNSGAGTSTSDAGSSTSNAQASTETSSSPNVEKSMTAPASSNNSDTKAA